MMIQMDGGNRLRVTLLNQMSTVEGGRNSLTGLTLEAILRADKVPPPPLSSSTMPVSPVRNHSNRTLLDVIRDEARQGPGYSRDKTAWKSLREMLRLKRTSVAFSNHIPTLDSPIPAEDSLNPENDSHRHNQLGFLLSNSEGQSSQSDQRNADASDVAVGREGRLRLGAVLAEERELSARETDASGPPAAEVQPPRMSLMELLEENDGQMGLVHDAICDMDDDDEPVEEEGETAAEAAAAAGEMGCCVCMIRSKGAAFIPCGHTFCRLCCRELWVQRGNCPLCNASILEVLDIF